MNRADVPPGHHLFRFGAAVGPWDGEPGDIILERGVRVGTRLWLVVHVEPKIRWAHVVAKRVDVCEFTQAALDGAHQWVLDRRDRTIDTGP